MLQGSQRGPCQSLVCPVSPPDNAFAVHLILCDDLGKKPLGLAQTQATKWFPVGFPNPEGQGLRSAGCKQVLRLKWAEPAKQTLAQLLRGLNNEDGICCNKTHDHRSKMLETAWTLTQMPSGHVKKGISFLNPSQSTEPIPKTRGGKTRTNIPKQGTNSQSKEKRAPLGNWAHIALCARPKSQAGHWLQTEKFTHAHARRNRDRI